MKKTNTNSKSASRTAKSANRLTKTKATPKAAAASHRARSLQTSPGPHTSHGAAASHSVERAERPRYDIKGFVAKLGRFADGLKSWLRAVVPHVHGATPAHISKP